MNARMPENKDAVLLVVGMMLAAYAGQNLGTRFHSPVLAFAITMTAGLGYFFFAYIFRANWYRATLSTVLAFVGGILLEYVRQAVL